MKVQDLLALVGGVLKAVFTIFQLISYFLNNFHMTVYILDQINDKLSDNKEYSEKVSALIDSEVSEIMTNSRTKAEEIVKEHRKALDAVAHRLIEVETIEQEEYEKIILAHGIIPKKKLDIEHQG